MVYKLSGIYKLLAVLLLTGIAGCSSVSTNKASFEHQVDALLAPYSGNNPGAALLLIEKGEVRLQRLYGQASFNPDVAITENTNFRLASVSKAFTTSAMLSLIERGYTTLDTPIRSILPTLPEYTSAITVAQLLSHTSGIPDYEPLVDTQSGYQVTDADVLTLLQDTSELFFTPGSAHKYSNTGYALLALLVEKLSGQTFSQYVHDYIFQPIGINNSVIYKKGENEVTTRAYGHSLIDNQWRLDDQSPYSVVLGDGGVYSNLQDLYKWAQAWNTGTLLSAELMQMATTPYQLNNGERINYGFGWRLKESQWGRVFFHPGETRGFRNVIYFLPEQDITVVLLTNRNGHIQYSPLQLAERISDLYLKREH